MKTKTFDCVAMKRRGAERVRAQIEGMTLEEEVAFWQQRTQELRERQRVLREQAGPPVDGTGDREAGQRRSHENRSATT